MNKGFQNVKSATMMEIRINWENSFRFFSILGRLRFSRSLPGSTVIKQFVEGRRGKCRVSVHNLLALLRVRRNMITCRQPLGRRSSRVTLGACALHRYVIGNDEQGSRFKAISFAGHDILWHTAQ